MKTPRIIRLGFILILFLCTSAHAHYIDRALLLLKVLQYDKNISSSSKKIKVCVLSTAVNKDMLHAIKELADKFTINNKKIIPCSIDPFNLSKSITSQKPSVIYTDCNIEKKLLSKVIKAGEDKKILICCNSKKCVKAGAALGIESTEKNNKIILNPKAAKKQGSEFDLILKRYAEIIGDTK